MNNTIDDLIGDVLVSEQLATALELMAPKEHRRDDTTCEEIEELKKKIDMLMDLVGDTSVSEQIYTAINNIK